MKEESKHRQESEKTDIEESGTRKALLSTLVSSSKLNPKT